MAIELTVGKSEYQFRISPDDDRVVERRLNVPYKRWYGWRFFSTAADARAYLLRLEERVAATGAEEAPRGFPP